MPEPVDANASSALEFLPTLLRSLGIPADLRQRESIQLALSLPGAWTPRRRAVVIAAILGRSARQHERLEEELTRWLTPAAPEMGRALATAVSPEEAEAASDAAREKPPSLRGAFTDAVRERPRRLFWIGIAVAVLAGLIVTVSLVGGVIGAFLFPFLPKVDLTALREYVLWALAAAITLLPVFYLCDRIGAALRLYRRTKRGALLRPVALKPGRTYFPTGQIAAQIAPAWFGRSAILAIARAVPLAPEGVDRRRLSPAATVARTVREGGLPTLVYRPRKLTVRMLVLGDRDSGARGWSDLPQRLCDILGRTGIEGESRMVRWHPGSDHNAGREPR